MAEENQPFDFARFQAEFGEAQASLAAFVSGPCMDAGRDIEDVFARAGQRMARALAAAAEGGEGAFRRLTKVALEELAKIALDRVLPGSGQESTHAARGSALGAAAQAMAVHFHFEGGGDADSIRRSQAQIAAQVARAAAYGRRNL